MQGMNVIVPLGGLGVRFQNEGYTRPKPFVRVLGKEMILWVLDNLNLEAEDSLVVVYNPAFLNMDVFMAEVVRARYSGVVFVELEGPTRGAAETVLLGLRGLPERQRARPSMLVDGDCFYTTDIIGMYRAVSATHNATFTFHDTQLKPIYSYVTVDGSTDDVMDIREKVKISDHANTGCYCFRSGAELERYCVGIIDAGVMQLSQDQKGEFYTSGVIKAMLDDDVPCRMLRLEQDDFHVLGTPAQVQAFCRDWPHQPPIRVVFALMGTLLDSQLCPIERNVDYCRRLYDQGHSVVVSCSGRPSAAAMAQLKSSDVRYTSIEYSRARADFFVDAAAVDALQSSLESQLGFYRTNVVCARAEDGASVAWLGGSGDGGGGRRVNNGLGEDGFPSSASDQANMLLTGVVVGASATALLGLGVALGASFIRGK